MGWKDVAYGTGMPASFPLTATITNPSSELKQGRLSLVASGLDGRLIERDLGEFSVAGGASRDVSFSPALVPLQSEIATSFVVLQAEVAQADGYLMRTGTQPLYYRFQDNYSTILLHHVDDVAGLPGGGTTVADTMDVRGRVFENNGQWLVTAKTDGTIGGKLGLTGVRAVEAGEDELPTAPSESKAEDQPAAPLSASMTLCSTWRVQYIDSGKGEDVYNTASSWTDVPAAFAKAYVLSVPGNALYWQGHLNAFGCTPSISLPAGTFRLQQSTANVGYEGIHFDNYYMSGGVEYTYEIWADFTSSGSGASTLNVHPTYNNDAIQAAAIASQEVYWHWITLFFGGGGLGLVNGTYKVHANEGCGWPTDPPTDSCYDPNLQLVHLGTSVVGGYTDAHWKYVVAHETGHMVQDRVMGRYYYDYDQSASQALCKCDHYTTEWGNRAHCLQSREQSGGAQQEGFAHAFASRVFNNPFQADGTFVYYKPFLPLFGPVQYPPIGRDAFAAQRWMENYCLGSQVGVEYDWLLFEYNVSSRDRENATDIPQLFDIYKMACTGTTTLKCAYNQDTIQWSDLRASAQGYYGAFDPRYQRFHVTGEDFGVDH